MHEHAQIVQELEKLRTAEIAANQPSHERFAKALMLHAQTEESVLYPPAILLGLLVAERLNLSTR